MGTKSESTLQSVAGTELRTGCWAAPAVGKRSLKARADAPHRVRTDRQPSQRQAELSAGAQGKELGSRAWPEQACEGAAVWEDV